MNRKGWLVLVVLVIGGLLVMTTVEPFSQYSDRAYRKARRQWLIMTGGMVNVGGYYLRIDCWGSGQATVVFDSGLNQPRDTWGTVPGEVSKSARVCTYDRAGVGESDHAGFLRTSLDVVSELKLLLEKKGENGPFVLVGHSFGGINVRLFAMNYPEAVRAIMLVEPSHEDQYQHVANSRDLAERERYLEHEGGANNEQVDLIASAEKLKASRRALTVPVVLVTGDTKRDSVSAVLNAELARQERFIHHIAAENAGHFPQLDRPDIVIAALNKLLSW